MLEHTIISGTDAPQRTLVMLHGLFGRGRNFTTVANLLVDRNPDLQVMLVDLPNHGRSPWTDTFSYTQMADAVAELIADVVDGPVVLLGHSMGGKTAMLVALRHPELVSRLIVVDISPVASPSSHQSFSQLIPAMNQVPLDQVHNRSDAEALLRADVPDQMVRQFLLQNLRHGPDGWHWQPNLALLTGAQEAIAGWPEVETQYRGPVLWIAGSESNYVRAEHAPAMRALFPSVRLVTVKGANHWVHATATAVFVDLVDRALRAAPDQI